MSGALMSARAGRFGVVTLAALLVSGAASFALGSASDAGRAAAPERVAAPSGELPVDPPLDRAADGDIGTPVRLGALRVTVLAPAHCGPDALGSGALQARPESGQFCSVRVRIANTGAAARRWSIVGVRAYTQLLASRPTFISPAAISAVDPELGVADLPPGAEWTSTAYFDVPMEDELRFIEFGDSATSDVALVQL